MKRIFCFVLALSLICLGLPLAAAQSAHGPVYSFVNEEYAILHSYKGAQGVVEIPAEYNGYPVKEIREYAFAKNGTVEKIILPETLTKIGYRAFEQCTGLKEIHIPQSVTQLGESLFSWCPALERVTLPPMVERLEEYTFYMCTSLKEVTMPVTVEKGFGTGVFVGCESLTTVELPQGIRQLPYRFFSGCSSLREITLPTGLESIEVEAFLSCSSLERIEFPLGLTKVGGSAFQGCTALKEVKFPQKIEWIGNTAFRNCTSLSTVNWPLQVLHLGARAFENCVSLTELPTFAGLETIEDSTFEGCKGLTRVELSEDVVALGNRAFYNCSNLETLKVHGEIAEVGKDVLFATAYWKNKDNWENKGLYWNRVLMELRPITAKTFTPLQGTRTVASGVFGEKQEITTVILPEGLTHVSQYAFDTCTALKTLVMGKDVVGGGTILKNCTALKTLYWEQEREGMENGHFGLYNDGIPYQIVGDGQGVVYGYHQRLPKVTYVDVHAITLGDPNGDGTKDAKDALAILQGAVEVIVPYGKQADAMDVNADRDINAKDALEVLKFSVGKSSVLDEK